MKKVAFIIQCLTKGGAERTISNLSLILKDELDVYIIVYDGERITYPYAGTLIDLKLPPMDGKFNKLINVFRRVKAVREIKKQYNFDCVVSFMFGGNIVNVLSGHIGKIITSARNYMSSYGTGFNQKFRERFVAGKSDFVVALSKMVEKDLNETFGVPHSKTVTIYNPCDIDRIKHLAEQECPFAFDSDCFYFVTAGRMVKQKGQWHLLKAFSEMKKKAPNAKLIILGSGELEGKLKKLAADLNIDNDVIFTGFIDNPYAYISRSNCFVLSSLFEGLGNVIIEAMACEVPVISYDCLAGPRELIAPEADFKEQCKEVSWNSCGVLVPAPSKSVNFDVSLEECDKYLADAMTEVYNNPLQAEFCTKESTERIKQFTPQKITEQWLKLF